MSNPSLKIIKNFREFCFACHGFSCQFFLCWRYHLFFDQLFDFLCSLLCFCLINCVDLYFSSFLCFTSETLVFSCLLFFWSLFLVAASFSSSRSVPPKKWHIFTWKSFANTWAETRASGITILLQPLLSYAVRVSLSSSSSSSSS